MTSTLAELNTNSQTTLNFTDNRPSEVLFNFLTARDVNETITSNTFTLKRKIDIIDIIQPSTADVKYYVDIDVAGATANFGTLPSGVTVATNGGNYTVSGITSVSDWQAVRAPTITLPATFNGTATVDAKITYYNSNTQGVIEKQWTHGNYFPVGELSSNFGVSCTLSKTAGATSNIGALFGITADLDGILGSAFTIFCDLDQTIDASSSISSAFAIDVANPIRPVNNLTYLSNQENEIFSSNTPVVQNTSASSVDVKFTVASGAIGLSATDILSSTVTLSGTPAYVNANMFRVKYYPDFNVTANTSLTIELKEDGIVIDTFTTPITRTGAGSITTTEYILTSTQSWTMPYWAYEYGQMYVGLVGGGGGGSQGGGGAGSPYHQTSFFDCDTLGAQAAYNIVVGTGGAAAPLQAEGVIGTVTGGTGGISTAFGYSSSTTGAEGGVFKKLSAVGNYFGEGGNNDDWNGANENDSSFTGTGGGGAGSGYDGVHDGNAGGYDPGNLNVGFAGRGGEISNYTTIGMGGVGANYQGSPTQYSGGTDAAHYGENGIDGKGGGGGAGGYTTNNPGRGGNGSVYIRIVFK